MTVYARIVHWKLAVVCCRHQLIPDDDLGPLYDLLIDDPPEIRHAIGALVYDHLIAQKFNTSQSGTKGFTLPWLYSAMCMVLFYLLKYSWSLNILSRRWKLRGPSWQNVANIERVFNGSNFKCLCHWWCLGVHEGYEGILLWHSEL